MKKALISEQKSKRGFTIAELVIVIAVVAILAAVLVPTFSGLVERAKLSADKQLVKSMNTVLAVGAADGKNASMHDALADIHEAGYDLDKLSFGADLAWDQENDRLVYADSENNSRGEHGYSKLWRIAEKSEDVTAYAEAGFHVYLADGVKVPEGTTFQLGVDVGNNTQDITFQTSETVDVIIRTNGGTLTVDAENATVYHYGSANAVHITAIADKSYHEFGAVGTLSVGKGRVVIEKGALVQKIITIGTSAKIIKEPDSIVLAAPEGSNIASTEEEKSTYVLEIATAAQLAAFRDSVNCGLNYDGLTVKLTADIDLSAYPNWLPIGHERAEAKTFNGTFDGQGHTISNLSIDTSDEVYDFCEHAGIALFGKISHAHLKDLTVEGTAIGNGVAGVVASCFDNSVVGSVTSNVTLTQTNSDANACTGGICAIAGQGATFIDCTNNGRISSANGAAGGIVGLSEGGDLSIRNCKNTATVENTIHDNTYSGLVGGIVGRLRHEDGRVEIKDCTNDGAIQGALAGGIVADLTGGDLRASTVRSCTNNGDVTSYAGDCGGIIGNGKNVTLKECAVGKASIRAYLHAGGLVGCFNGINEIAYCTIHVNTRITHTGSQEIKHGKYVGIVNAVENYAGVVLTINGSPEVTNSLIGDINQCLIDYNEAL